MNSKQIALAAALLALVFLAHAAGRFTQIGGAQFAPSIAIYMLAAYLLATQTNVAEKIGIAILVGILTMIATSSPFPPANIPSHGGSFLLAAFMAQPFIKKRGDVPILFHIFAAVVVVVVSWTLFALFTWIGLTGTGFTQKQFTRFDINFGTGFIAWWLFGWIGVGIPTLLITIIVTPILYKLVKPVLVRQGMI